MGEFRILLPRWGRHGAGRVADAEEAGGAAAFGFGGVDGEGDVVAASGVSDVIGAAPDGTSGLGVVDVEDQWGVDGHCRVQA